MRRSDCRLWASSIYRFMQTVSIDAQKRDNLGKKNSRAARREGLVPGVIYGGEDTVHFTAPVKAFKSLLYTPDFKLAEITVDGTTYRCMVKSTQFHPVTDDLEHIDLLQLVDGNTIKAEIPVRFKGVSPGVKAGGKLLRKMRRVKVKTQPEYLVDELHASIDGMELGSSIRVRDIEKPEGIEFMSALANPIATVEVPRALRSAATKAEKEG